MDFGRRYEKMNPGKRARVCLVANLKQLQAAFRNTNNIDAFIYVGHSGVDGTYEGAHPEAHLFLRGQHAMSADVASTDIQTLPTGNVIPGAFFYLYGCGTAATRNQPRVGEFQGTGLAPGVPSLAQAFAQRFHTGVWGYEAHITPGYVHQLRPSIVNFNTAWASGTFLGDLPTHNGSHSVLPVLIRP